jgi:hypothetical protein
VQPEGVASAILRATTAGKAAREFQIHPLIRGSDMEQERLRRALLLEMHRKIDQAAAAGLSMLENRGPTPVYPPSVELTQDEIVALTGLRLSATARSAFEKIFRDVAAAPLFDLLALMDGVVDPEAAESDEPWLGVTVVEGRGDDDAMWHDELFETYWDHDAAQP